MLNHFFKKNKKLCATPPVPAPFPAGPTPPRPKNWQGGHGRQLAHPQSYPQDFDAIAPKLSTPTCG